MPGFRDLFRRRERPRTSPEHSNDSGDAFALTLYGVLQRRPGNLAFSPFGLRMALALAHVGARGDTAAQMAGVLGLGAVGIGDPAAPFGVLARFDDAERHGLLRVANAPRFRADQPFLFAIRDWRSGAILFLGRVVDPSHLGARS